MMDKQALKDLKDKVEQAEKLQKQIDTLDEFIACCNSEVGFLNVTMNYRQQNEIKLTSVMGAREAFDGFKIDVQNAAIKLKAQLETQYKNMK